MHLMYQDGQKFGQLDNVKFFVPWSTLFKNEVLVKRIYADKFTIRTSSSDKYLGSLLEKLNSREYDMYPNVLFRNYSIDYKDVNKSKDYLLKGNNLDMTKLNNFKSIKIVTDGIFYINDKQYIKYNISATPNIELNNNIKSELSLAEFAEQVENLDFHSEVMADLKIHNNFNNEQRSENIRALKMLLTNKKVKLKKYHKEAIEKGIQILEHEIEENKEY